MEQKETELSTRIEAAQNGDKAAREALIEENIGLVRHIVKRFLGRGYDPIHKGFHKGKSHAGTLQFRFRGKQRFHGFLKIFDSLSLICDLDG